MLHNSHLEEIAARKPQTIHELGSIKGIGLRRAARYGEELLALVRGERRPIRTVPRPVTAHIWKPPTASSVPDRAPRPSPNWLAP